MRGQAGSGGLGGFTPPETRQREDCRTQAPHARSGSLTPDATALGQSAHRLPQSVLPGGPGIVYETATKEHLAVLANLPYPTGSDGSFGGTDPAGPQASQACQSDSRGCYDLRTAA